MDQQEYDLLYEYIRRKEFPTTISKNKKDSLRRKSKQFEVMEDGLLYFKDKKNNKKLKVSQVLFIELATLII